MDLSKCEIKENHYSEERERYGAGSEVAAWNVMAGNSIKNTRLAHIKQIVLSFELVHNGEKEIFYSGIIPFDKTTLLFKLDAQKTTTLYVDRRDRKNYLFDLDFLLK